MNTNVFKVPYGLTDNGLLVNPMFAQKDEHYRCPSCNETLTFRNGEIVSKHFSHKSSSTCSYESLEHILGKLFVQQAINEHISGSKSIQIKQQCVCCLEHKMNRLTQDFFLSCQLEKRIDDKYVCDVVAETKNGKLGIEVFNTHRIGEIKENELSIHWIEIEASSIIENHYEWFPINQKFPFICDVCLQKNKDACKDVETTLNKNYKLSLLQSCQKCSQTTLRETPENFIQKFSKKIHEAGFTCGYNLKTIEGSVFLDITPNKRQDPKTEYLYLRIIELNSLQEKTYTATATNDFNNSHICEECLKDTYCDLCPQKFNSKKIKYRQPPRVCDDCFERYKDDIETCVSLGIPLDNVSIINYHLDKYPYTLSNMECESCHCQTPVFHSNKLGYMYPNTIEQEPPVSIKTISASNDTDRYWTNTCFKCKHNIDLYTPLKNGIIKNLTTEYPFVKRKLLYSTETELIKIEKQMRALLIK